MCALKGQITSGGRNHSNGWMVRLDTWRACQSGEGRVHLTTLPWAGLLQTRHVAGGGRPAQTWTPAPPITQSLTADPWPPRGAPAAPASASPSRHRRVHRALHLHGFHHQQAVALLHRLVQFHRHGRHHAWNRRADLAGPGGVGLGRARRPSPPGSGRGWSLRAAGRSARRTPCGCRPGAARPRVRNLITSVLPGSSSTAISSPRSMP